MSTSKTHAAAIAHLEAWVDSHRKIAGYEHERMQSHIDGLKEAQAKYNDANGAIRSLETTLAALMAA
ncbi:hypothetical protein RFN29_30455 [Mesorhizobium sp. VK22B]|uniref:Uncharacterized protein n=1 Tax=Mesorhizobium captivum TaxID=3072319 RepID=A0ABU4Z9E9_9HYPH|nr:hypothetical protein [Mesorhizobium sp. VK22B]MDX8495869.1 hypothetical protein [Mesorhizobium sp. VK22B]